MKRKFKLFATVASLCLCLALMAFGVYAASNVTYTASGSVKFEANDVYVIAWSKQTSVVNGEEASTSYGKEGETANTAVKQYQSYTKADSAGADEVANWKPVESDQNWTTSYEQVVFRRVGDYIELEAHMTNKGQNKIKVVVTYTGNSDVETSDKTTTLVTAETSVKIDNEAKTLGADNSIEVPASGDLVCTLKLVLANSSEKVEAKSYSIGLVATSAVAA